MKDWDEGTTMKASCKLMVVLSRRKGMRDEGWCKNIRLIG